ncbi:MAG: hypothetical protein ACOYJE_00265 [Bacteroidaceae bacterium]|jgi:hypothetical protein
MKKTSTQSLSSVSSALSGKEQPARVRRPKEATLNFLRLFARSYYGDSRLPEGLQGFILN